MSEELKQEVETQVEGTEQKVEKTDPYTERAMELGWRPEEEWNGAPEDFIDAKEFVRRQPLFEKIEGQSRELKALKQAFDAFKTHHTKVKETEYQRALAALKAERRRALSDGETDKALAIEDQIEDIQGQKSQFEREQTAFQTEEPTVRPEFVEWSRQNTWYGKDRAMTAYADRIGVELSQKGYSPADVLAEVSREIKKEFANKFSNPKRDRPGSVEGGRRGSTNSEPEFELSDEERRIMNKLIAVGGITKEEYIKELKRVRG